MAQPKKPKTYKARLEMRILIRIIFGVFTAFYRIKPIMPKEVRNLKSPYLVLGNHVGFFDPFVTGVFLPKITQFVSSDAAFSKKFFSFFLKGLGTIPTKKNVRDTQTIRDIIGVINQGGNVGIFPEAVRNWCGDSFPIDPSIAKLIKLLKVPVVVPKLKGMNLFNPRWSTKLRPTRIRIEYTLLFTRDQILEFSKEEIHQALEKALRHSEVDHQRQAMNPIRSKHKAEYVSHVLYLCPECQAIDSFDCQGNDFHCRKCGYDLHINEYGFYHRRTPGAMHFDNIRDWYYWQESALAAWISKQIANDPDAALFEDQASVLYALPNREKEECLGPVDLTLYPDKIRLRFLEKDEVLDWKLSDFQTINPQVYERLEIIYKNQAYRIVGGRPGVSALKWEVAANVLWKLTGETQKLSPYILTQEN